MGVISCKYLDEVCEGDKQMEADLLDIFVEQMGRIEMELDNSLDAEDYNELARRAHKYKSTALSMGMLEMTDILKKIEIIGKKMYVASSKCDKDDSYKALYINQINGLTMELNKWAEENMTVKSVKKLIDFCKLQAKEAIGEVDLLKKSL